MIHIEIQGYKDIQFPERMFSYFYRIRDRWKKDILAIAIFTDDDPSYHPKVYEYNFQDTKVLYQFNTFKLLDKSEIDLQISNNPFSIVMQTARKSLIKKELTDVRQLVWKKELVLALKNAKYDDEKINKILRFIRFYVKFEKENNFQFLDQEIQTILNQRKNMGIEEIILEEIKEQMREEVKEEAFEEGLQKGELKTKIKGIQKALQRKKLSLEEIAEDFEVTTDFVLQVQRGELQ